MIKHLIIICFAVIILPRCSNNFTNGKTKYISKFKKYCVSFDRSFWHLNTNQEQTIDSWDASFYSSGNEIVGNCKESRLSYGKDNLDSLAKSVYANIGDIKSFKGYSETINGMNVRSFDIEVEYALNGILYRYNGFIYSSEEGSFQFTVGTQKNIFDEDYESIIKLMKGFSKNQ
jgi:hypothetical protein